MPRTRMLPLPAFTGVLAARGGGNRYGVRRNRPHTIARVDSPRHKNYSVVIAAMLHTIGEFEQLILFALVRLGSDAYGVPIRREIETRTGRAVSPGALYTALDRLEKRGLVTSRLGEPTPERGGKRKRLYTLQPAGERALARVYESLRQMASGVSARLRTAKG
jgi:PadR family transcriptional regulator PadR